ncbi:MAG: hypothetical protein PHI49_03545 [Halothiobacillaceae bacterium]|nr:hypothetical protein [Halothiobacillaceae bacterium]
MSDLSALWAWIEAHGALLTAVSLLSFGLGVITLLSLPALVARLPADYFCHALREPPPVRHPLLRLGWLVGKNLAGSVLILAGLLMLILPGQGVLTLLIGLILLDFPGKYRLERALAARRPVLALLNGLRRRAGKPPLHPPPLQEEAKP